MHLIDYSGFRCERTPLCVLLAFVLSACGAPFTASTEALTSAGAAGDAAVTVLAGSGGELAAQAGSPAAGGAAPAPQGGAGGERTTTSTAGAGTLANAGAGGSAGHPTASDAGAGDSGAASCLAGWKGSSCDKCAAITDQTDREGCQSVVDCCESKHLDCHNACTVCGCGFAYDQPAADVYTCRCGAL